MRQFAMPPQKCSLSFPRSDRIITSLAWELVDAKNFFFRSEVQKRCNLSDPQAGGMCRIVGKMPRFRRRYVEGEVVH